MNPRDLGQGLRVDCAFKASGPEKASEDLCARAARLLSEAVEPIEIALIDAERNHSGFLFHLTAAFKRGTRHQVTADGQGRPWLVDLRLTWRCPTILCAIIPLPPAAQGTPDSPQLASLPYSCGNHHVHRHPEFHRTTLCVTGPRNQ